MNEIDFGPHSPGRLSPISFQLLDGVVVQDHAFVPNPIPPTWTQQSCWDLIVEAAEAVRYLDGLARNLPNPTLFLRPLGDREAIQSSRLEGTFATAREALLFDVREGRLDGSDEKRDDWREVTNYSKALAYGTSYEGPLSLFLVRSLHEILLRDVERGKDKNPGSFRDAIVGIGDPRRPRFVPPPVDDLQDCLDSFEKSVQTKWPGFHPIVVCLIAHYQFETIHPFFDGNGRIGRLLLSLMIRDRCELSQPWLYLSEFFEKHRNEYIQRLYDVSAKGDWDGWVRFGLEATKEQAKLTANRCEQLLSVQRNWTDRVCDLKAGLGLQTIINRLFESPMIDIATAEKLAGVSNPTARSYMKKLEAKDIVRVLPEEYPLTYYAPEIYQIAYADLD